MYTDPPTYPHTYPTTPTPTTTTTMAHTDMRIEDYFYNKLDRQPPARMTNSEQLGQYMVDAGNGFGPGTAYGRSIVGWGGGHPLQTLAMYLVFYINY